MTGYRSLEQVVHVVVAKPITWTLYLIWLAAKYGWRWTRHGLWLAAQYGWRWTVQFGGWCVTVTLLTLERQLLADREPERTREPSGIAAGPILFSLWPKWLLLNDAD